MGSKIQIGLVFYDDFAQLDVTGPFEVLSRIPFSEVELIAPTMEPIRSDTGLRLLPTTTLAEAPVLDVVLVSGGPGQLDQMRNDVMLAFLRRQAASSILVGSVCTGAFLLGAAGLLEGHSATTHWSALDQLASFGATPTKERVVVNRGLVTSAGVTAGIDLALVVAGELGGPDLAEALQLGLEYDPRPPFDSGTPSKARASIRDFVLSYNFTNWSRRAEMSKEFADG